MAAFWRLWFHRQAVNPSREEGSWGLVSPSFMVRGEEGGARGAEWRWGLEWVWTRGTKCPQGASHGLSSDPGAPAGAEGGSCATDSYWAGGRPRPDSSAVPVGSGCCRKGQSSDHGYPHAGPGSLPSPFQGPECHQSARPYLRRGRGYCGRSGALPGV